MPFTIAPVLELWGNFKNLVRDDGKKKVNLTSSAPEAHQSWLENRRDFNQLVALAAGPDICHSAL